jgi:hypothetical protein
LPPIIEAEPVLSADMFPVMSQMGSKGGRIGGRLEAMSHRKRVEIAKKTAQARWGKKKA